MKLAIVSAILLFSLKTIACGMHPGQTHEEWTSAVKDERGKNGAVVTQSDGFFSTKPRNDAGASSGGGRSGSGRPVAEETRR